MKARGKAAQEIQQGQADNNLQHFHPRPQPQPPVVQPQPPMPQPPIQQQPPLQQYGYPAEYPPPHGYHHPMHQYPPQPQYPQPAYGEYLPPRPQPPYDQYLPQHPPYGYHQHPHLHQFQPPYGQYPHGHQPPYLPYNQPNPSVPYQQAPDQSGCIFHMPPEDNHEAQTNSFFAKPFPQDYRPHPEYNMLANTNNVASTIANNTTGNNHPEEKLEPMVTQFNNFILEDAEKDIAEHEQAMETTNSGKLDVAKILDSPNVSAENLQVFRVEFEIAAGKNKESAGAAIELGVAAIFVIGRLVNAHFNQSSKVKITIGSATRSFHAVTDECGRLIQNLEQPKEQKAFIALHKAMEKAYIKYLSLEKIYSTAESEFGVLLTAAKEAAAKVFAVWEQFKNSKPIYTAAINKIKLK